MPRRVGLPYSVGSVTSKAAAKSMVPHASNLRKRVWEIVASFKEHGITCDELEQLSGFCHQSASTRLLELYELGRVDRPKGCTRLTRANRHAQVHVAIAPPNWTDKRPGWPTPETSVKLTFLQQVRKVEQENRELKQENHELRQEKRELRAKLDKAHDKYFKLKRKYE